MRNNKKKINIALIGLGYWGPNILRTLSTISSVNKILVIDKKKERLKSAKKIYKKILSFPINKNLSLEDVNYICKNIKIFYKKIN